MSATFSIIRARSANRTCRYLEKVSAAFCSFTSISASDRGSKDFISCPVAGLTVAIAITVLPLSPIRSASVKSGGNLPQPWLSAKFTASERPDGSAVSCQRSGRRSKCPTTIPRLRGFFLWEEHSNPNLLAPERRIILTLFAAEWYSGPTFMIVAKQVFRESKIPMRKLPLPRETARPEAPSSQLNPGFPTRREFLQRAAGAGLTLSGSSLTAWADHHGHPTPNRLTYLDRPMYIRNMEILPHFQPRHVRSGKMQLMSAGDRRYLFQQDDVTDISDVRKPHL